MSHCADDRHAWSAGSTEEVVNAAGETQTVIVFRCLAPRCGGVRYEQGAIIEPHEQSPMHFTQILEAGSEPDD